MSESVFRRSADREDHAARSPPSPPAPQPPPSIHEPRRAQLRNDVLQWHHQLHRGLPCRALLRLHRLLLAAPLLQPHHQLDHRARGEPARPGPLRADFPPAGVGAGPHGHQQHLLLPDPRERAAQRPRVPGDDHPADQQRLQHAADAHRHGPGPLLRRVPPAALQRVVRGGPLALAAGAAHLDGGAADPAQFARAAEERARPAGGRLVREGAADRRQAREDGLHQRVHAGHPLHLRADSAGGEAARGAEPAQPGRVQNHRAARHPAGSVHPPQLCELRAGNSETAQSHPTEGQGPVRRGGLRLLQLGAVHCGGCLRTAQRGTSGASGSQVPLLLPLSKGCAGMDSARQMVASATKIKGANADNSHHHL